MTELVHVDQNDIVRNGEAAFRLSTNAAGLCAEIVKRTAIPIQGKRFVSVEGWQSIAVAHGCVASSGDVEVVPGGVRAVGYVRRISDGMIIAQAEGFVGEDEPAWYGGSDARGRALPPRPMYAIRAMAQTRAISRACRSAFAHVVVLIDADLSTTPAEEVIGANHEVIDHRHTRSSAQTSEQVSTAARTQALRRLYAALAQANLVGETKTVTKQRVVWLANRYLEMKKPVVSMDDLEITDLNDLARCISDDPEMARDIVHEEETK